MIQNTIMVQKNNNCLKVPIKINEKFTDLNVYVLNEINSQEEIKTFLSLDTEALGAVQIYFKMSDGNISLRVNSDRTEATEYLMQNASSLQALLSEAGYEINELNFGTEATRNPLAEELAAPLVNAGEGGFEFVV